MGFHYQSVCCLIIVFLAAIFRPAFSSEYTDIYLIQDNVDPIGVTGVGSSNIGSFLPLIVPLFVMMMPVKMADGRMMNMIEMLMMKPTVANPPTTATTTTRKPPDPCVPRCPAGYVQVPDQSVSNKCFRAGRGQASFTAADAECSETTNANLWCPGSIAEDRSVRSKLKLGTETLRIGCNDQDKDASYTCKGTERKCDPKNPSFGEKAEGTAGCNGVQVCEGDEKGYCVNIAFDDSSKDKKKWLLVECNSENLFVCEVPIIPC